MNEIAAGDVVRLKGDQFGVKFAVGLVLIASNVARLYCVTHDGKINVSDVPLCILVKVTPQT